LTCLASADPVHNENTIPSVYEFRSPASRGFSLVMGKFKRQKIFDGTPPLYIYTHKPMEMPGKIDFDEIQGALKFFSQKFGSLEIQRLNILLKSGQAEGGISQRGLIIMTLPRHIRKVSTLFLNESQTYRTNKNIRSPVILRDIPEDYMIHEIAHQWWGGVLSPKDYQAIWINEGLAQLSLVLYLKKIQKPKKFSRMIRVMRRWVLAHNAVGPVIYGKRILSLTRDFRFYQSVVYNKPAFVFLMLIEMIGEESFFQRLRDVMTEYKYKTVNTRQFINRFSRGDNTIKDFLSRWIYQRAIPKIRLVLAKDDPEYDLKHRKRIVLMIKQEDTDFIFPLRLRIDARGGREFKDIIISRKNQRVVITRKTPIHTIETIPHFSLFKEVMVTPVERKKFKF
jgi:aminopeptidase N